MSKLLFLSIILKITLINTAIISSTLNQNYFDYSEQLYRNFIIEQNRMRIQIINQQYYNFQLESNNFERLTQEQFQRYYLTMKIPSPAQIVTFQKQNSPNYYVSFSSNNLLLNLNPNPPFAIRADQNLDIDWNRLGYVTSPKNQGGCGSCWAFSAVSDLQSSYLLTGYQGNIDLSEQQVVDCSGNFYNAGCAGGWMTNAFAYIYKNPITTQSSYPYTGLTQSCKSTAGSFTLKNLRSYWQNKNCQLLVDILQTRPLAVAVAADPFYWGFYKSGVLGANQCSPAINHGVVVTGVKKTQTQNYWIVKNSWGAEWGQNGYLRIDRSSNNGNVCEICSYPQYSII